MILGMLGVLDKLRTNNLVIGLHQQVGQNIIFILYMISFTNIDIPTLALFPRNGDKFHFNSYRETPLTTYHNLP